MTLDMFRNVQPVPAVIISPVLRQLHWLTVRQHVAFKIATLDSRLQDLVRERLGLPGRRLSARRRRRCQTTAFCRHSNTRQSDARSSFEDRTFAAAGPQVWNSLPPN